jgi:putative sigma-54 modulation protein
VTRSTGRPARIGGEALVDINVSSRNVEVGPGVKAAAIEKIGRLDRYLDGLDRAEVHFAAEHNPRITEKEICEVTLVGGGRTVRAKVHAPDQHVAIDRAVEKLEHQLYALKSRTVDRHHGTRPSKPEVEGDGSGAEAPRIVKTKRFSSEPMTTDEAILTMELLGHRFFVFVRSETGAVAVVYVRDDGDVGLIELEG